SWLSRLPVPNLCVDVATAGRYRPPCPAHAHSGLRGPRRCVQLELDVVGVAEHEHGAVVTLGNRRVHDVPLLDPQLPSLQLGAAVDAGADVVEAGAELVEVLALVLSMGVEAEE